MQVLAAARADRDWMINARLNLCSGNKSADSLPCEFEGVSHSIGFFVFMSIPTNLCVSYSCRQIDPLESTFSGGRQGQSGGARLRGFETQGLPS